MSSPPDDTQAVEWFRRFDAASRRLPAEERASQHQEIQQHLEGLVASNKASGQSHDEAWQAALTQFGDPTQIGRKVYQEWCLGRTGFRADMAAIWFGFGLQMLTYFADRLVAILWFPRFYNPADTLYTHGAGLPSLAIMVSIILDYGLPAFAAVAIGRKYPSQAIKSAFYGDVFWHICFWIPLVGIICSEPRHFHPVTISLTRSMLWLPAWLMGQVTVAYLASVTKRGWYKPSLTDFKLTLPRRGTRRLSPRG